jgi:hypothetical protein
VLPRSKVHHRYVACPANANAPGGRGAYAGGTGAAALAHLGCGVITFAAGLVCGLLAALAVFQALLAIGAPLGRFAWGGQHRVLPRPLRVGSIVSIGIYALLASTVLARADLLSTGVPERVVRIAAWVVAGYFFLGIGMNLLSRSKSERAVMSPVVALLCGLCVVVAAS